MFANLTNALDFQGKALSIRAERQRVIASNIANADTPGYASRDINFKQAMASALGANSSQSSSLGNKLTLAQPQTGSVNGATISTALAATHPDHIPLQTTLGTLGSNSGAELQYTTPSQPAMDNNTVDMDQERANFVDNSVRYEATLTFINGSSKTILSAIQGQ
jgi:flagellar basal-body rod protein FlgB